MPIYEYRCSSCGHQIEVLQKFSDPPQVECPHCHRPDLVKLVSAAGFQLKGSGWYVTDFRNSGAKRAAKAPDASSGAGDGGAKDKPAAEGAGDGAKGGSDRAGAGADGGAPGSGGTAGSEGAAATSERRSSSDSKSGESKAAAGSSTSSGTTPTGSASGSSA
jgi:putative FmdB family regulatory protein